MQGPVNRSVSGTLRVPIRLRDSRRARAHRHRAALIPTLRTGQGLWRIMYRSFVVQHWITFARTGDPGWAVFDSTHPVMTFSEAGAELVRDPRSAERLA